MKFSFSRKQLYDTCPYKYKLRYLEGWYADKTYTPLLFGSAMDKALNYVLLSQKLRNTINVIKARKVFIREMKKWKGQNELVFFKYELPAIVHSELPAAQQEAVWENLCVLGYKLIDTYISDIIPLFSEILEIQIKKEVKNDENDELIVIIDFIAKMKDGSIVILDNKTAATPYPKNSVKTSEQLPIYSEVLNIKKAGYIVLSKKPEITKNKFQVIIDDITEEQKENVYNEMASVMTKVKNNEFPKNEKSCFSFGRPCEYFALCKHGNSKGLLKKC